MLDDKDKKKKKKLHTQYTNPFEAFQDIGTGIADEAKTHAQESGKVVWDQLFGGEKSHSGGHGGDLQPGQELDLIKAQQAQQQEQQKIEKHANNIRPGIDYIGELLQSHEATSSKETQALKQDIQDLIMEIKSLAGATSALEKQVIEATGTTVVNPGKYHKSFFRWVISIIKDARQKIDNANVWLSTMKGKQKKGMGAGKPKKSQNYWDLAEQHGVANFTLSGERSTATQTG